MSSTIATVSNVIPVYKGKVTHRSWPQLPEELIRQIATFYLWDLSATSYCPHSWETRDNWHQRMVYTALRDANELEKQFMSICPQWCQALETHLFWQQAIALIDPGDVLAHYAIVHPKTALNSSSAPALPTRLSPHRHFRNITSCSCIVCRINRPTTSAGLTYGKRYLVTPWLKTIQLCRDHDRRRIAFCGLCLREQPVFDNSMRAPALVATEMASDPNVACLENEDEDTWPGVDATCRSCRSEWLWKRMCNNSEDREAIGGPRMLSEDWETRQSVDGFIDMAEGSINDVVTLAREKWWLRKHTRLAEYVMQAVAAAKYNNGRVAYDGSNAEEEEEVDEEEEDEEIELMQMSEENGIRDIALGDWARARILDGYWCSPADSWYNNALPGRPMAVRAVHPCPWARESPPSEASSPLIDNDDEQDHPKQSTSEAGHPPSFSLCEQAYLAHQRQMRVVLMPAMRNIVRKVVIECSIPNPIDGRVEDPAIRAARMDLEDVLRELREEEGVWFDGVDWAERRRNDGRERESRARENGGGSDDSSTSSGSRSSNGTSPVLSTTTLQTTPSPPPILPEDSGKKDYVREEEEEEEEEEALELTITGTAKLPVIAVGPVLDPPKLLWPIPYVPVTAAHMPHYSVEAFKLVWREACAPLYHCRCSICERAAAKANAANPPPPVVVPTQVQQQAPRPTADTDRQPATIRLEEVVDIDGEGEDEIEEIYEEEEEDGVEEISEPLSPSLEALRERLGPDMKLLYWNGRKRSSNEVEAEDDDDNASVEAHRGGTPPKRARFDKSEPPRRNYVNPPCNNNLRKRSSEELEDACVTTGGKQNKKAKVSTVIEGDLSESPPPTSDYSLASSSNDGGPIESADDLDYIFRGAERCGSLEGGDDC